MIDPHDIAPGTKILSYKVLKKLGQGRNSSGYLARGPKSKVVIKVPGKFEEHHAMSMIGAHPNIIPYLGSGCFEGIRINIFEYRGEKTVQAFWKKLTRKEVLNIVMGMLKGIEHIHLCGFAHDDIGCSHTLLHKGIPILFDIDNGTPLTPKSLQKDLSRTGIVLAELLLKQKLDVRNPPLHEIRDKTSCKDGRIVLAAVEEKFRSAKEFRQALAAVR